MVLVVVQVALQECIALQRWLARRAMQDISVDMEHRNVCLVPQDISIMFCNLQIVLHVQVDTSAQVQLHYVRCVWLEITVLEQLVYALLVVLDS
jgi:hypothetical protein